MATRRILVVDDEQHILDVVVYVLEENAFEVVTALDGDDGLRLFESTAPELVILDIMLPGITGLDVLREMRAVRPDVPIIMLTSRSEEIDRVLGLELGADDYVTKPFSTRELLARVRAVLRRLDRPVAQRQDLRLVHGPIALNPEAVTLTCWGEPVALTRAEFKLMECLVRYPATVFTRDVLMDRIYDGEHVVTDRSIDAYVKRLRRKFADVRPDSEIIQTVHGMGYKMHPDVEHQS